MKWISAPRTSARKCVKQLSIASWTRQSYLWVQCSSRPRVYTGLAPPSQPCGPCSGGSLASARRTSRSARTRSSTRISNGLARAISIVGELRKGIGQRNHECPQIRGELRGPLPGAEVPAGRHLGPAHHVERALGEAARRNPGHVARKQRERHRTVDMIVLAERRLPRFG